MDSNSSPERGYNAEIYKIQNKLPGKLPQRFKQGNSPFLRNKKPESPIEEATNTSSPMSVKNSPMSVKNSPMSIKNSPMSSQNSSMSIKDSPMSVDDEEDLEIPDEYFYSGNCEYDHFGDEFDVEDFNVDIEGYLNYNTPPVSPIQQDSFEISELNFSFEDLLYEYKMSDNELSEEADAYCDMPEDVPLPCQM